MMSKISKMYFAFVKKFKEHVKISIGNLKPPKKVLEQFNGLGNWGFIGGGTGWAGPGEPLWVGNRALSLKLSKNPISYA